MSEESQPREPQREPSSAVAEKPRSVEPRPLPPYKVLLHNDDVNPMDHVVRAILELTPLRRLQAIRVMLEAHRRGVALVLTTHKERAELYRDQFASKRLMVTIEPECGS